MELETAEYGAPFAPGIAARTRPGPGERVLWLHGYTLDARSWDTMWSLLPGWHHVGIDLPGHGASDPIPTGCDIRQLGQKLAAACLEQDVRHIVALSFGTITAIQIAIEQPAHFASLVLGAPSMAGGPQDPEVGRAYGQLFARYHQGARGQALTRAWMSCRAWNGVEQRPGLEASLGALVDDHTWDELRAYSIRMFTHPVQQESDLRSIRCPTLILVGEHEMPAFMECADTLERNLPRSERHVLPDTGHLCMLQSPELSAVPIANHLRAQGLT